MKKTKNEKRRLQLNRKDVQREKRIAKYGTDSVGAVAVDFNRRFVAAFLALVFALSCLVVGVNFAARADEENDPYNMQTNEENNLVLKKGIQNNYDGTYSIKMESYATGSTTTEVLDQDVPLDIVMVLDQSGSMLNNDINTDYTKTSQISWKPNDIGNSTNYYVLVDGEYYQVKAEEGPLYASAGATDRTVSQAKGLYIKTDDTTYTEVQASSGTLYTSSGVPQYLCDDLVSKRYETSYHTSWHYYVTDYYVYDSTLGIRHLLVRTYGYVGGYRAEFYYLDNEGSLNMTPGYKGYGNSSNWYNNIHSVTFNGKTTVEYSRFGPGGNMVTEDDLVYKKRDYGTNCDYTIYKSQTGDNQLWYGTSSNTLGDKVLFADQTAYSDELYQKVSGTTYNRLYYIKNGEKQYLTGNDGDTAYEEDNTVYESALYTCSQMSRLDALKTAAKQFAEAVGQRAKSKNVDHRIAVVGFANNEIPCTSTTRDNIVDVDRGASEFITTNTGIFVDGIFKSYITPNLNTDGLGNPIKRSSGSIVTESAEVDSNNNYYLYTNLTYFMPVNNEYLPISFDSGTYTDGSGTYDGFNRLEKTNDLKYQWVMDGRYSYTGTTYYEEFVKSTNGFYYPSVTMLNSSDYKKALVKIKENDNTSNNVNDYIDTALNDINAYGGTYMSYGLAMAGNVFKNNTESGRKRIVVVFTDGQPGDGNDWDDAAANEALATAAKLKSQYEASVYTVGLYPETPSDDVDDFMHKLSSEYYSSTTNVDGKDIDSDTNATYYFDDTDGLTHAVTWYQNKYDGSYTKPKWTNTQVGNRTIPTTTHVYSGAQQQAEWKDSNGWLRGAKWNSTDTRTGSEDNIWQFYEVNAAVEDKSGQYYYDASDGVSLNDIFETISEAIQTPTTTVALNSEAVLKDIIADNFILPDNPENHVTIETYNGSYSGSSYSFDTTAAETNPNYITKSWDVDNKTLSVTGFDYGAHYIADGSTDGQKLVVTINGLVLRNGAKSNLYDEDGYMKIPSNTSDSGVYRSSEGGNAYAKFPIPYVLIDPYATYKNGMVLSKRIGLNETDKTYDLTLKAYSTGKTSETQIPTDYVLVVDQSGSMSEKDVPTAYSDTGTTKNWTVADGAKTYYYKVVDDSGTHYYRVYRKRGYMFQYHAKDTIYSGSCVSNLSWFQSESDQSTGKASQYWYNPAQDTSGSRVGSSADDRFYPVTVSAKGGVGYYGIRFRYTNIDGTSSYLTYPNQPYYKSPTGGLFGPGQRWLLLFGYDTCNATCKALTGYDTTQYTYGKFLGVNTGMYVRQVLFTRHSNYSQLAYKDDDGVEHVLIDATYCNSSGTPVGGAVDENGVPTGGADSTATAYWNGTLYTATSTISRLEALKASMKSFVETVAATGADHRIAVCGFSSLGDSYTNTELLTGTNLDMKGKTDGIQYGSISDEQYSQALLEANKSDNATLTGTGEQKELTSGKLLDAINALTAKGGTEGEYGFYMAKNILDKRTSTTADVGGKKMDRLKIIVYFTDGTPGNYAYSNQYEAGNKVVDAAAKIKMSSSLMDTEIYSIGTFGFADAEPLTYQKYTGTDNEYTYDADYVETNNDYGTRYLYRIWLRNTKGYGDTATDTVADYMRTISSEYPGASKFVDATWYSTSGTKSDSGVYTDMVDRVRGDGSGGRHYFLCTDLTSLDTTFRTVATGTSIAGMDLDVNTILRDTIDGTKFDYSNAEVTAEVVKVDKDGKNPEPSQTQAVIKTWEDNDNKKISSSGVVEVTGVNYSEDYAGTKNEQEVKGDQLIVYIKGLKPLQNVTGDTVYSNTDNAGVYLPAGSGGTQVCPFAKPFISRHSITLDVGNEKTEQTFTVETKVLDSSGSDADRSNSSVKKIVLVDPEGNRLNYSAPGEKTFTGMGNNKSTFYYESIPDGYQIQTSVTTDDSDYKYYVRYDGEGDSAKRLMTANVATVNDDNLFDFDNHVIHINSEMRTQTVTIKEAVTGSFSSTEDLFAPEVYMIPSDGTTIEGNSIILGNYTWTKVSGGENRWTTSLDTIKGDETASILLTVPTGWKLYVSQEDPASSKYQVVSTKYTVDGSSNAENYPEDGLTLEDDITITITNQRDEEVITGLLDNDHFLPIWVWALIGVCLATAAGFYVYDKKKKKKV